MNRTCIFIDLPNLIHTFTDLFASKYELQGNLKVLKAIDFKTLCLYLLPENSILTRAYIYSAKEFLFVPDREILDDFEKYKKFFLQKRAWKTHIQTQPLLQTQSVRKAELEKQMQNTAI